MEKHSLKFQINLYLSEKNYTIYINFHICREYMKPLSEKKETDYDPCISCVKEYGKCVPCVIFDEPCDKLYEYLQNLHKINLFEKKIRLVVCENCDAEFEFNGQGKAGCLECGCKSPEKLDCRVCDADDSCPVDWSF